MSVPAACADCLSRSWLLARLAGHLDLARDRIQLLLGLQDADLLAAVAGREEAAVGRELSGFDDGEYRRSCAEAGLELICRCNPAYPGALRSLPAEPAVLHVAGGLTRFLELAAGPAVSIVGARRASPYGLEAARSLARAMGRAGVAVVSGMALGVDSAAHEGALQSGDRTIAVLAAAPQRPYPAARRALHQRILSVGCAVSELGPDVAVRRWMFHARNRIIAALSVMTVVVAARRGSGSLVTARLARSLERELGAVPGQVTAPLSWGPHELIRNGARLVATPSDVLVSVLGQTPPQERAPTWGSVPDGLRPLLAALADGHDLTRAFAEAGLDPEHGLSALAALELAGHVHRLAGGRYQVAG